LRDPRPPAARSRPDRRPPGADRLMRAWAEIEALVFDVFGTLVDWRSSIAAHVTAAFAEKGRDIDAAAFADAWRAEYQPAMERIRSGHRAYVPLDDLHRENLMAVLAAQ